MHRRSIVILTAAVLGFAALQGFAADTWYITTVAGTGKAGYSGDGGPATQATFNFTGDDLFVDDSGVLYIADGGNNRIRKIDRSGMITTIAGNGVPGFSGDGGPATKASLNKPVSIDIDRAGNLYISDLRNNRIRKVDTAGIITTVAGTGKAGYSGDGGPATDAELTGPGGIRSDDAGNLYVGDMDAHVIRKIDTAGIITTVAGTGAKGSMGDGGLAIKANLNNPQDLWFDRQGNLYICEGEGKRIRKVDASGNITTIAGGGPLVAALEPDGGPAVKAVFAGPCGVCIDSEGNILIADTDGNRLRKVDGAGLITTIAGIGRGGYSGDGGPAAEARLARPNSLRMAKDGTIYFLEFDNHVVRKLYRP